MFGFDAVLFAADGGEPTYRHLLPPPSRRLTLFRLAGVRPRPASAMLEIEPAERAQTVT
jgi:hypothetical protein